VRWRGTTLPMLNNYHKLVYGLEKIINWFLQFQEIYMFLETIDYICILKFIYNFFLHSIFYFDKYKKKKNRMDGIINKKRKNLLKQLILKY